jgi:glycosyltransferase involved in cell wall biosynthesis
MQAYAELTPQLREQIGLVFVGDGVTRPQLVQLAAAISPGTIQFTGFLQRNELASYYALAEAFVFPTHSDPWGLVINEAMACGLPVICTNVAGCVEDLVLDRWNGVVVRSCQPSALASAMEEMASGEMRGEMGTRSQQRILQYSPSRCSSGISRAFLACQEPPHA